MLSTTCNLFSFHDLSTTLNRKHCLVHLKSVRGKWKKDNYCKHNSKIHDKQGSFMILWFQWWLGDVLSGKKTCQKKVVTTSLVEISFTLSGFIFFSCFKRYYELYLQSDLPKGRHQSTRKRQQTNKKHLPQVMGMLSLKLLLTSNLGLTEFTEVFM